MEAIQVLKDEHRVIEQVLDCLEVMAGRCESEGRLEADAARSAIDFFRVFADTCHHGKEEAHLFEMMASRGFSKELGPVAVMLVEHEQGRARIRGMSEAVDGAANGEPAACRAFVENARAYLVLLREHIQKEDDCLFPMAAQA
ncbi:MAG: hemerythrin domain-containing protein, partial [Acidobacteriota bacterium]|nr:hemerythrin domain-containing protein [Acidobacteriota bacterium]